MTFNPRDPRVEEGIRLFNQREFFDCHDVFEDLWTELTGPERPFFQGLIHAAVALFHFEGGNLGGARKMVRSCLAYLGPFSPDFHGIDVARLMTDLEHCFAELCQPHQSYPSHLSLDSSRIPVIRHTRTHAESAAAPNNCRTPESD